jgi:AcrR family transcriptional regulator
VTGKNRLSRGQQKAVTRDRVLSAARRLFLRDGFDAVTIKQIAEEAEVAVGTVFIGFDSKADLLVHIACEDIRAQVPLMRSAIAETRDQPFVRRLIAAARLQYAHQSHQHGITRWIIASAWTVPPELEARYREAMGEALAVIGELTLECIRRGELRPDLDLRTFVQMLNELHIANYRGAIYERVDNEETLRRLARQVELVLQGARAPERQPLAIAP